MSKNLSQQLAAFLYGQAVNWRLRRYYAGKFPVKKLAAPVLSVGNLTVGGTGKTPCTAWLANFLRAEGLRVAILSRGYKRASKGLVEVATDKEILCDAKQAGDEPFLLAQLCPGVRVVVNANRYEAGHWVLAKNPIDVFVLDDGFQHIQLHRDINILLLDSETPVGNGALLPHGILREPPAAMRRADVVIATRTSAATNRAALQKLLVENGLKDVPLFFAEHAITNFKLLNNAPISAKLQGANIAAFSGIAQPQKFFADLQQQNFQIVSQQIFPDHHKYSVQEIQTIFTAAQQRQAVALITTEKDAVNLPAAALAEKSLPLYAAQLAFKIESDTFLQNFLRQKLQA